MLLQEAVTINVIDMASAIAQRREMPTHEEIRAELIRQIDAEQVKQVDVARKLGIAPARVAEMRKGLRRVQMNEMEPLAEMLGMIDPDHPVGRPVVRTIMIPHLGKVAQGLFLEQSLSDPDASENVPYDISAGDPAPSDLFAVTPEGGSMNKIFAPGLRLICQRVPFGTGDYRSGDLVIVERTAHDLRELTCKRLRVDDGGQAWLESESTLPEYAAPWFIGKPDGDHHNDMEICVIGRVLRGVVDFRAPGR